MSAFYDLSKTPRNILNQAIVRAIISENNGALFDPSDLSTLYQDAAGTIPVTAVEQPVGKMLDKSGNGYHATQSITASRPTLSARYNLLTKTEDFSDAVWVKTVSGTASVPAVTKNYSTSPDGSLTATRLQLNKGAGATASDYVSIHQGVSVISGVVYSGGFWIKSNDGTTKTLQLRDDLGSVVATLISATPSWSFISFTGTSGGAGSNSIRLWLRGTKGTSDAADISIWQPDFRQGTTSGPYQRVNTATDYDTDERYFQKYLRFDGIDDYLSLPYMGLYANGSASVVSAVKVNNAGVTFYLVGEGNTSNNNVRYGLARLNGATQIGAYLRDDTAAFSMDTSNNAPLSLTASMVYSITDNGLEIIPRANSGQKLINPYLRPAQLTTNATAIGAMPAPSFIAFTPHNLYSLIITKSALTDAQRIKCERYSASKSGVQL